MSFPVGDKRPDDEASASLDNLQYIALRLFNSNHNWNLAPARGHALDADDRSVNYQQGVIEVVHRGADVSRNEIKIIAYRRNLDALRRVNRQMLFARFLRRQIRMAERSEERRVGKGCRGGGGQGREK